MTVGYKSKTVEEKFDGSPTGGAVTTCCKNVKGKWTDPPKLYVDDVPKYMGNPEAKMTQYFDTGIPKGVSFSVKIRYKFSVRGTLVCTCADDGRKLSETKYNEAGHADVQTWVGSKNFVSLGRLNPWLFGAEILYDAYKLGKKAYDIYNTTPEQLKELAGDTAKKAVEKAWNSADELCKSKHKPCQDPPKEEPAPPAPPAKPGPGEADPSIPMV